MRHAPQRNLFDALNLEAPHITEVRRLLQSLMRSSTQAGQRVYMVTSARRGDGKSTTCGLLALVAARVFRKRTLIIDTDVRAATIHQILGISKRPGFCELLQNKVTLDIAIHSTPLEGLFAIPIGSPSGAASEAYDDAACKALIEELRPQFDLILIDAAPVVPVVEPMMLAEHVDGVLVVVMAGRTPLTVIQRMKQILQPVSSKISGVILSNALSGLPYYYDYRYYGYHKPERVRVRSARGSGGEKRTRRPSSES